MGQEFGNAAADQVIDEMWEPEKPKPPPGRTSVGSSPSSSGGSSSNSSGMISSGGQSGEGSSPGGGTVAGTGEVNPNAIENEPGIVDPDAIENEPGLVDPDTIENGPGLTTENEKYPFPPKCPYCGKLVSSWGPTYRACPNPPCLLRMKEDQQKWLDDQIRREKASAAAPVEKPGVCPGDNKPVPQSILNEERRIQKLKAQGSFNGNTTMNNLLFDGTYTCTVCGKTHRYKGR